MVVCTFLAAYFACGITSFVGEVRIQRSFWLLSNIQPTAIFADTADGDRRASIIGWLPSRQMWDGSPSAGRPLCLMGGVETHRGGLYQVWLNHTLGSATRIISERPRGARRMAFKGYSTIVTMRRCDLGDRTWYP